MDCWLCLDTRVETVGFLMVIPVYAMRGHTLVYLCD